MKKIIVNLYSTLSEETGKELIDKCSGFLKEDCYILFDAENLESITREGYDSLNKLRSLAQELGNSCSFYACNLKPSIEPEWLEFWKDSCFIFANKELAIRSIDSQLGHSMEKETKPTYSTDQETKESAVACIPTLCPHCATLLFCEQLGFHTCHSCGGSFYLHKNGLTTPYEKLL